MTHSCHDYIYKDYVQYLRAHAFFFKIYLCLIQTLGKFFCKNASMIATSFRIHGSFIYLPFPPKTCSSGIELAIKSDGKILCTYQIFSFLSLLVRSETSSCLEPINFKIMKLGIYLVTQFYFLSKFLIMTKSPILYCGMSSYFSLFC